MTDSEIITNTLIRKRLLKGPIAPSYEKAVSAWPELKKHIKSPKSYLKELALARVYEAIKAEFGPELANGNLARNLPMKSIYSIRATLLF